MGGFYAALSLRTLIHAESSISFVKVPLSHNLDIPIRCSRWLKGFYLAVFAAVIVVLVVIPLSHSARALLLSLTLFASIPVIGQVKFLSSVKSLHFRGNDLSLSFGEDRKAVEFVGRKLTSGVLTVFGCRFTEDFEGESPAKRMVRVLKYLVLTRLMYFVLLPDSLSSADHHALRVRLKGAA